MIPTLVLAAALCAPAAFAQDAPGSRAARVDSLFARYDSEPSPGLALVVVRDGRVVLRRGYGLANLEHRVRITPETVFDVASVSKQFTGLAVAMLVAEGRIALSDEVRRYIPELPARERPITIGQLVHHTSGVRDWPGALSVAGWRYDDVISSGQILALAYRARTLNFEPGADHLYSNTGYNLLAELVARVTGQSLAEWSRARLFRPLGMTRTHFRTDYREVIPDRAYGYRRGPDGAFLAIPDNLVAPGSSSLFSSVDDLGRWLRNFDDLAVGGREAHRLMRTPGRLDDGTPVPYAFGVLTGTYRGMPMFTHGGGWAGFDTYTVYMPEQRLGIAVLANSDEVDAQRATIQVANVYLDVEESPAGTAPAATPGERGVSAISPAAAETHVGLYRLGPGRYLRIDHGGGGLTVQETGGDPQPLTPVSAAEYVIGRGGERLVLSRDSAHGELTVETAGVRGRRVQRGAPPSPPPLAEFVGTYESPELGTSYEVTLRADTLALVHPRHGRIPLTPLWRDDFGSAVWFLRSVEFQRDGQGRVTGFLVNGDPRNRDIRFDRRR
ncbi:MAG TPA: serine hydrolase [Longimicrobiaceae bacterium]|nr:serine hydrolase [Longimicrobiaceae bacterium]